MNTYRWVCKACEVPNVFVHDPKVREQITLTCYECGHPGSFNPVTRTMTTLVNEPAEDTCSTNVVRQDLYATNVYIESMKPLIIAGTYYDQEPKGFK